LWGGPQYGPRKKKDRQPRELLMRVDGETQGAKRRKHLRKSEAKQRGAHLPVGRWLTVKGLPDRKKELKKEHGGVKGARRGKDWGDTQPSTFINGEETQDLWGEEGTLGGELLRRGENGYSENP